LSFTAFISDLHLTSARPRINRIFFSFLEGPALHADALYILGDLFEYWAGDDDLVDPLNAQVAAGLKAVRDAEVPVYLMRGNRDLLLLDGFARASGSTFIADPTIVDLYGTRTLLMHGDTLCTADERYQAFRRRAHSRLWQRMFLAQPLRLRRAEIHYARRLSEAEKKTKAEYIMDVAPAAVDQVLRDSGSTRLIHGHTHRPARHAHVVDGRSCERWVLSDWYDHGDYLSVSTQGCTPVRLD
jgi:UDP-2,3-diacylglucosamine hydrolase